MTSFDNYDDPPFFFEALVRFSFEDDFNAEFRHKVKELHELSNVCDQKCCCVNKVRLERLLNKPRNTLMKILVSLLLAAGSKCEVDSTVAYTQQDVQNQALELAKLQLESKCDTSSDYWLMPVDEDGELKGMSLLHIAIWCDCLPATEYIARNYRYLIHVTSLTADPMTPVQLAEHLRREKIFQWLLADSWQWWSHASESNEAGLPETWRTLLSDSDLQSDDGIPLFHARKDVRKVFLVVAEEAYITFAHLLKSYLEGVSTGRFIVYSSISSAADSNHELSELEHWKSRFAKTDAMIVLTSELMKHMVDEQVNGKVKLSVREVTLFGELIHQRINTTREKCVFFHYDEAHLPKVATHVNGVPIKNTALIQVPSYLGINRKQLKTFAMMAMQLVDASA